MFERICMFLLICISILVWLIGCNIQGLDPESSAGLIPWVGVLGFVGIIVALSAFTKMELGDDVKKAK